MISSIQLACRKIIACENDFYEMKKSGEELYHIFSTITGIDIHKLNEGDIYLPSGKAISPSGAAHCLIEMKRTAVFLRGINKAINLKLADKSEKPIRILYAGTGPFGSLVIPLLPLYKPTQVIVDLLEINPLSLEALQKVIDTIGLRKFIGEIYCADATTFKVNKQYDIVISETMLACLRSEPQVAIMQNLIPQLSANSIFIPEEISIDANLTNSKMEQDRLLFHEEEKPEFRRIELGNVFKVTKNNLDAGKMRKVIDIPVNGLDFPILKLFTTVTVFENEVLCENDSSITLPVTFCDLRNNHVEQVEFCYKQGAKPLIECKILVNESVI